MNKIIVILVLILTACSPKVTKTIVKAEPAPVVKKEKPKKIVPTQTEMAVAKVDSLYKKGKLQKKFYPNMSGCGGALYGYYYKNELQLIDSKYGAELGYSSKKMYWKDKEIVKIIYHQHVADWEAYEKKYPQKKYKFNPSKMTYSDTTYIIQLGKNADFKMLAGKEIISTTADNALITDLANCGKRMVLELESVPEYKKK